MDNHNQTPELKLGQVVRGSLAEYKITKMIRKSGRGRVFLATVENIFGVIKTPVPQSFTKGAKVIIKIASVNRNWGSQRLIRFVTHVNNTLQRELTVLPRLLQLDCVVKTFDSGIITIPQRNGVAITPIFIVQEYVEGPPLDNYLQTYYASRSSGKFQGISSSKDWFSIAESMAGALKKVHQLEIVHRDIWPPNIIINNDRPIFIDFGEAAFRDLVFKEGSLLSTKPHPYMAPENRHQPWWPSRRADIYSMGGVLYYMATGNPPPMDPLSDNYALKERIAKDIEINNGTLLAENCGTADIIARCLRSDRNERIGNAEALLQEIRAFQLPTPIENPSDTIRRLEKHTLSLGRNENLLFDRIADVRLREVECVIQDMGGGVFDIIGNRGEIATNLMRFISVLERDDEYLSVSTPHFWMRKNLGHYGRYFCMNRIVAERGVRIRRVFLLTEEDKYNGDVMSVIRAHLQLWNTLSKRNSVDIETKFLEVSAAARRDAIYKGDHKEFWIKDNHAVLIIPVYDEKEIIRTIRLRVAGESPEILKKEFLDRFFAKARSFDEWESIAPYETA